MLANASQRSTAHRWGEPVEVHLAQVRGGHVGDRDVEFLDGSDDVDCSSRASRRSTPKWVLMALDRNARQDDGDQDNTDTDMHDRAGG
ncbi:hypothetical protein [Amycolatopsis sp. CA-230715]|uniref:hypothetical protein n=1 Tax=Amycolatopsis sp. CA-230715 TaxID=2745196 RepID=UPI001C032F8D|nr:hypothetical protein [Amycolatopsis sp. CA-230715]